MKISDQILMYLASALFFLLGLAIGRGWSNEVYGTFNTRSAQDHPFDWHIGGGFKLQADSTFILPYIDVYGSREREKSSTFYSRDLKAGSERFFYIRDQVDTERGVKIFNVAGFYTWRMFKAGADIVYTNEWNPGAYLAFKWRFASAELTFWDRIIKARYSLEPATKPWHGLSAGLRIRGVWDGEDFNWENGLKVKYEF